MNKGIIDVATLYGVGFSLTGLAYFIGPKEHGLGLYIIVFFGTLLVGLFWTGSTLRDCFLKGITEERKGVIYSNAVIFLALTVIFFYFSLH